MNTLFNSPEDAINACNAEAERAWAQYITAQTVDFSKVPQALAAAKNLFLTGYYAGARWVSDTIVIQMNSLPKQPKQ